MDKAIFEKYFKSVSQKLARAERHIKECQEHINSYISGEFTKLVKDQRSSSLSTIPLPEELDTAIADVLHNLNACLDQMTSGLMRSIGEQSVKFPSKKHKQDLVKSFDKGPNAKLVAGFPWLKELVLDEIQPFQNGQYQVWEVRQFDNNDKHEIGIVMEPATLARGIDIVDNNNNRVLIGQMSVRGARAFGIVSSDAGIKSATYESATATAIFPKDSPAFGDQPVIETCLLAARNVRKVAQLLQYKALS
ncbi:hypothetical protein [Sinorhizobium meliloti]|uniref:hypothetical protein n=1 Tax=Rhizobium meliloti TaxID=382 RepID=UPI00299D43B0|nr:hypothetical protein [Sinorhizobium meliloti]